MVVKIKRCKSDDYIRVTITNNEGKVLKLSIPDKGNHVLIHTRTSSLDEITLSEKLDEYEIVELFGQTNIKIKNHM